MGALVLGLQPQPGWHSECGLQWAQDCIELWHTSFEITMCALLRIVWDHGLRDTDLGEELIQRKVSSFPLWKRTGSNKVEVSDKDLTHRVTSQQLGGTTHDVGMDIRL